MTEELNTAQVLLVSEGLESAPGRSSRNKSQNVTELAH